MLYIVTALYEEALPFLQELSLKKDAAFPHFELFSGGAARLLITKTGALRSAIAVSSMLAKDSSGKAAFSAFGKKEDALAIGGVPPSDDFLLAVGTAACADRSIPAGTPFFIQKITDSMTGRRYFPELLYRSPFSEAELVTVASVQKSSEELPQSSLGSFSAHKDGQVSGCLSNISVPLLYDMEGSGVFEASSTFLSTHQIAFIKVVSDHMSDLKQFSLTELRAHITSCISKNCSAILSWVSCILEKHPSGGEFSLQENALFQQACAALRLSVTSQNQLRQLMLYLHCSQIPYLEKMKELLLPFEKGCKTKKEGLQWLEQAYRCFL